MIMMNHLTRRASADLDIRASAEAYAEAMHNLLDNDGVIVDDDFMNPDNAYGYVNYQQWALADAVDGAWDALHTGPWWPDEYPELKEIMDEGDQIFRKKYMSMHSC